MNESLKEMNSRGFLCAPLESSERFQHRVNFLQDSAWKQELSLPVPLEQQQRLVYDDLDLDINWLYGYTSKKGLSLWEPAATWIMDIENVSIPLLQLKTQGHRLEIELLKHEAVHAARARFQEPIYEEFLAYATSSSKSRKIWGPLLRSSKEALMLMITTCLPMMGIACFSKTALFFIPMISLIVYLAIRLRIHQRIFQRALKKIILVFDVDNALKVAIRLTDREIQLFGKASSTEIQNYINQQNCLRWKQIRSSYKLKIK